MKKIIFILVIVSAFLFGNKASAQSDFSLTAVGDVSPITLNEVHKINDTAKTKDTTLPAPAFNYNLQPKRYLTTVKLDTIRAAKISSEPLSKLYRTYARIGVGNYSSFMGEFYFESTRSKTAAWGTHKKDFSAGSGPKDVAGKMSGFSSQDFNIYGKTFLKKHTLYGGFDYDRDVGYNYGSVGA